MKNTLLLFIIFSPLLLSAQRYISSESYIKFFSSAPLEDIEATNTEARSVFDKTSGEFAFTVPIKSFQFKKSLMQEHFNENYLESDEFPSASLRAKIKSWDDTLGEREATVSGELVIHGVKQLVEIDGKIDVQEDKIIVSSVFPVALEDHDIKIPKAVFYKIAEVVEVTVNFTYEPYED